MGELGTHPATERAGLETLCLRVRAPRLYPDSWPLGEGNR